MRILTRYLIRAHVGPFFFALSALTGMLFLNAVAQRLENLVGKGLTWDVIGEFLLLSLPHTVALTLPMAVLVAVLYAFSELTASNEITAMAAGGIKPTRLLVPMVVVGTILAGVMLFFNDRVLPESNHRLANLMVDIGQKSPTFQLREQVVNEVETGDGRGKYFLQAAEIDPASNRLTDVVIYDVSDPSRRRTIHADSGSMAFNRARTDLFLTLYDGVVFEVDRNEPGGFQRLEFEKQVIPLRGIADELQRQADRTTRSDREMSIAMLDAEADERERELREVREDALERSRYAVRRALGILDADADSTGVSTASGPAGGPGRTGAPAASDGDPSPRPQTDLAGGAPDGPFRTVQADDLPPDDMTRGVAMNVRTSATRAEVLRLNANRYRVELHKKYTIAFACIVFVLIGAPLALRFPRGGVGLVIAASVGIFAVYWMGLIGGEKLADKGIVDPFWAMWAPNVIFLVVGLLLVRGMNDRVATARGGGWDDLVYTLRRSLGRLGASLRGKAA